MGVAKESDTTERLSKQIRMSDIPDIYPKTSTPVKSSHFSILHPYSILPVNSLFGGPQTACSQVKVTHQWDKVTYTCPEPHMFAMALPFLSKSFIPKTPAGFAGVQRKTHGTQAWNKWGLGSRPPFNTHPWMVRQSHHMGD